MASKVFISYAHGNEDHVAQVLALTAALRNAGLEVATDGDVVTPQGPPEGWPAWMVNRIDEADWVLIACDDVYYRRYRGIEERGRGLGVRWEATIISTALYTEGSRNRKFVPLLFGDESYDVIPEPLRSATHYRLPADRSALLSALQSTWVDSEEASTKEPSPIERGGRQGTIPYRFFALGSAVASVVMVVLFLLNARLLVSLGLEGRFYYLALLLLGLAVTGSLFGCIRSFTQPRGKHGFGIYELGGPIAGFALVVIGGFLLPEHASNFSLTVYVHGRKGPLDRPLRNRGAVVMNLGGEPRRASIDERGATFFQEIPASFRGQKVNVAIEDEGYERSDTGEPRLDGSSVYLQARRKAWHVRGTVVGPFGEPVPDAKVSLADGAVAGLTGPLGQFDLAMPPNRVEESATLRVSAIGYQPWSGDVVANGGPVTPVLEKTSTTALGRR